MEVTFAPPAVYAWQWFARSAVLRLTGPQARPAARRRTREVPAALLTPALRELLASPGAQTGQLDAGRRTLLVTFDGARRGTVVDLSAQRRRLARVAAYAHQLEEGIAALPEAFVLYDAQDRLLISNPQYAQLYPSIAHLVRPGVTFEEIVRTSVQRGQFHLEQGAEEWLERRIAFHCAGAGFFEQHLRDGRWIQVSERRTRSGGIASIRADVTLLKERERALRRAMQQAESTSRSMSRFLAIFSHEVRNGLNGLVGAAQMLALDARRAGQGPQAQLLLDSGTRLTRVLSDLLDYLKNEATGVHIEPQEMDPRQTVRTVRTEFETLAAQRGLRLAVRTASAVPHSVSGDPARIHQVLSNLVSNAIKYSHRGSVTIALGVCNGRLRYSVSDQGVGIAAADLGGLFEFFSRAAPDNPDSTGLGLAISKQLVMAMQGVVGVQSRRGGGSRFWFDLPLRPAATAPVAGSPAAAAERVPERTLTVGVLDDDPLSTAVAENFLRRLGHRAVRCRHGDDAIAQTLAQRLDALLLDLMMPRESGLAVAARLRARPEPVFAGLAIVVVTGNVLPDSLAACRRAGADAVLQKPLFIETLARTLHEAVDTRRQLDARPAELLAAPQGIPDDAPEVLSRLRADIGERHFAQGMASALRLFKDLAHALQRRGGTRPDALLHRVQGTAPQLGLHALGRAAARMASADAATSKHARARLRTALDEAGAVLRRHAAPAPAPQ